MDAVLHNLVYQQLWTNVQTLRIEGLEFCRGTPPKKLHPEDEDIVPEFVLASYTSDNWTVEQWSKAFELLQRETGRPIPRVLMAMITNDSTVVYYFVHSGLVKPRKN